MALFHRRSIEMLNGIADHPHGFDPSTWPFTAGDSTLVFTCRCVFSEERPLLRVCHDEEGDRQFLCGNEEHIAPEPAVACLGCVFERNPSISQIADLPIASWGYRASIEGAWSRD